MKIVFFGTPEFSVASLDMLIKNGYDIAAVVTMPDKIAGRGHKLIESDVKKYAIQHSLRVLQPEKLKSAEFVDTLKSINADLFIVIAFRMLPEVVWSMPKLGTFNLHASLLPKYRGAAPINRAIMNGEKSTGITTFFLQHEIDTGDIIEQREIEISEDDNAGSIHDKLMNLGAEMVLSTVNDIENGVVSPIAQPKGEFIPAPKIFKEDCQIDWSKSAVDIHNQIRGLSPYPAAFTTIYDQNGKEMMVKIFKSSLIQSEDENNVEIGKIITDKNVMKIACGNGLLEIESLQPAGKKPMDAKSYLMGYSPILAK